MRAMVAPSQLLRVFAFPQQLLLAAALLASGVFALLLVYGEGYGIGQGFYVPLILVGAAAGPVVGACAGIGACVLYEYAIHGSSLGVADFTGTSELARLGAYIAAAVVTGLLARRVARMLVEALEQLDRLIELSRASLEAAQRSDRAE